MNVEFWSQFFQLNFAAVTAIIFLVVFIKFNNPYDSKITLLFRNAIIFLIGLIIVDNMDLYNVYYHSSSVHRIITAVLGYNLRIWLLICIINIMLRRKHKSVLLRAFLAIPAVITFFISMTAFNTHLMFWYDVTGKLYRGPLAYTPHIACALYGIFVIVYASRRLDRHSRRDESVILIIAVILMFTGVAIESLYGLRGLLISLISMMLIFYYLYMYLNHFKLDELTGVYNKASFNADIKKYCDEISALVSIDLNDLKVINDTSGHLEGDKALKVTSKTIEAVLPHDCDLYRVGGDEFFIICLNMSEDSVRELLIKIRNAVASTSYSLSSGFAMVGDKADLDEVYAEADANMYNEKNLIKKRRQFVDVL